MSIANFLPDILATGIAALALVVSIVQYHREGNRTRKEATIHAFDKLEEEKSIIFLFGCTKANIDNLVKRRKEHDQRINDEWDNLDKALPLIEHFAVGINSKIYDSETLNKMAGNQLISTFNACRSLIDYKRNGAGKEKNYSEFEEMVNCLIQIRKKNNQSIPA